MISRSTSSTVSTLLLAVLAASAAFAGAGLEPGSVYREYKITMGGNDWRVTDPDVAWEGGRAFLPNPELAIPDVDLEHAVRAEAEIDYWSGHPGTTDKKIRFNRKRWIPIEENLAGVRGEARDVCSQFNLRVEVPLNDLAEGTNVVTGSCGENRWGWGQWGWYALVLRVYYDPQAVAHTTGVVQVAAGADVFGEDPTIDLSAAEPEEVAEVRFLARYNGPDEDGDGVFEDFHAMMRKDGFEGHVGTATAAPWRVVWDTAWVPDQEPGAVALQARIRNRGGVWYATPVRDGLTFEREGHSVAMYPAVMQPEPMWVRDNVMHSAVVRVPDAEEPGAAREAVMYLRTWNVENNEVGYTPFRLNCSDWMDHLTGQGHYYDSAYYPIPIDQLQNGHNLLTFTSDTSHHGCEILWPGPTVLVRYER